MHPSFSKRQECVPITTMSDFKLWAITKTAFLMYILSFLLEFFSWHFSFQIDRPLLNYLSEESAIWQLVEPVEWRTVTSLFAHR